MSAALKCDVISRTYTKRVGPLQWRHDRRDSVSNHQPHDCLLNRLFGRRSKKTSKLRVTGLCAGNSPVPGEFPAQMASYAENVSIWWRHHDMESMCENRGLVVGCAFICCVRNKITHVLSWQTIYVLTGMLFCFPPFLLCNRGFSKVSLLHRNFWGKHLINYQKRHLVTNFYVAL